MHSWCQFYVGVLSKLYSIVKTFSKQSGNEAATSLVLFLTFVTLDVCPPTPRAILSIINVQISYISHQRESGIQAGGGVGGGGVGHRNRQTHACTHWNGKTVFWDDGDVLWWLRRRPTCPNWNFTPQFPSLIKLFSHSSSSIDSHVLSIWSRGLTEVSTHCSPPSLCSLRLQILCLIVLFCSGLFLVSSVSLCKFGHLTLFSLYTNSTRISWAS